MRVSDDELARMIENENLIGDRRIASCLRELRRAREAIPERYDIDRNTCMDDYKLGFNACIAQIEKAMRREE